MIHPSLLISCAALSAVLLSGCGPQRSYMAENSAYMIIPHPQETKYAGGSTVIRGRVPVAFPEEFASEASMLQQYLEEDAGIRTVLKEGRRSGKIVLKKDTALDSIPGQYRIKADGNIEISASSAEGVFYGIQSLRQMIVRDTSAAILAVRNGEINDWPAFQWRAFMLDDARNFRGMKNVKLFLDDGPGQDECFPLASDRRPGLAHRNQEISASY